MFGSIGIKDALETSIVENLLNAPKDVIEKAYRNQVGAMMTDMKAQWNAQFPTHLITAKDITVIA